MATINDTFVASLPSGPASPLPIDLTEYKTSGYIDFVVDRIINKMKEIMLANPKNIHHPLGSMEARYNWLLCFAWELHWRLPENFSHVWTNADRPTKDALINYLPIAIQERCPSLDVYLSSYDVIRWNLKKT